MLQASAREIISDPLRSHFSAGDPADWPPLVELREHAKLAFPSMGVRPKGGLKSDSVKHPISRMAEGFSLDDLKLAVDGMKRDEWASQRPKLHHLGWLCEEPDRVQKFITVATAADHPAANPEDRQAERARRATQRAKAESAIRAAYLRRKEPPAEATKLFTAEELGRMREEEDLRRESMRRAAE